MLRNTFISNRTTGYRQADEERQLRAQHVGEVDIDGGRPCDETFRPELADRLWIVSPRKWFTRSVVALSCGAVVGIHRVKATYRRCLVGI